jgi:hypothetical protein
MIDLVKRHPTCIPFVVYINDDVRCCLFLCLCLTDCARSFFRFRRSNDSHRHPCRYLFAQAKHKERFAIRAKYMTLDARVNKYIQYFKNIRIISQHLCRQATKHAVPRRVD